MHFCIILEYINVILVTYNSEKGSFSSVTLNMLSQFEETFRKYFTKHVRFNLFYNAQFF